MKKRRQWIGMLVLAAMLAGCGGASKDTAMDMGVTNQTGGGIYDMQESVTEEESWQEDSWTEESKGEEAPSEVNGTNSKQVSTGRKLIKTVDLRLETLTYDETIAYIQSSVEKAGGYIETLSVEGDSLYYKSSRRYANMQVRIPKDKTNSFLAGLDENTTVCEKSETTEDVTLQYVDVESHKAALEVEQERLMAILKKAETVADIIEIENRLSQVRYEIGQYESRLRVYDNLVDYTTIQIDVQEVERITEQPEEGAFARMIQGFKDSVVDVGEGIREFFIGFVISIPYLLVYGVILFGVVLVIKKIRKRRRDKKQKEQK